MSFGGELERQSLSNKNGLIISVLFMRDSIQEILICEVSKGHHVLWWRVREAKPL